MKVNVSKSTFLKLLTTVASATGSKNTHPYLEFIKVECIDNVLKATANDGNQQIIAKLAVTDSLCSDFCFLVNGQKIIQILKLSTSKADSVEIDLSKADKIVIKIERNRYTMQTLPVSDFPSIEAIPGSDAVVMVSGSKLVKLLEATSYAVGVGDHRIWMQGVNLSFRDHTLCAVGCNGHMLALRGNTECQHDGGLNVIVPMKAINIIKQLCNNNTDYAIHVGQQLSLISDDLIITSTLIDGKFPDIDRIIPAPKNHFQCSTKELLGAVRRVSLMASNNASTQRVCLDFHSDLLKVSLFNHMDEGGEAEDSIVAKAIGNPKTTAVNAVYLRSTLESIGADEVVVGFDDDQTALLIHGASQSTQFHSHIIMPMRG